MLEVETPRWLYLLRAFDVLVGRWSPQILQILCARVRILRILHSAALFSRRLTYKRSKLLYGATE